MTRCTVEGSRKFWNDMTEQQIPLPFRKPARLSAAQRKAMIQTKLQDYPVDQAAREAKRKHHVIEQFKNEQLSLWENQRHCREKKDSSKAAFRASISFPPDMYETLKIAAREKKVSLA